MRVLASGLVGLTLSICEVVVSSPVSLAQTASDPPGLTAGTFLLRGRIVGIFADNADSRITVIGGHINVSNSFTPAIDLSYFLTDHLAIEGEAGVTHNQLMAEDTAVGRVDVGKIWGAPVIALLQYHVLPRSRWNPYVGVGVAFLPYFGAQPAGGLVQQLSVKAEVGAAFQAGIDLQMTGRWYGNLDFKKLLIGSSATVDDGAIDVTGHISPLIVGLGIGYRF